MVETRPITTANGKGRAERNAAVGYRYYPSLDDVRRLAGEGNIIPVYREIIADLETPVSAFLKVAGGPYSFLLESVEGGERLARYSFIGSDPYLTLRMKNGVAEANLAGYKKSGTFTDPLVALQEYLTPYRTVSLPGMPRFLGGAVGYLAYEAVRYFERLPAPVSDPLDLPDALFMFVDSMVVFDHLERSIKVVSHVHADPERSIDVAYREATDKINRIVERLSSTEPLPVPVGDRPLASSPVRDRMRSNVTEERYTEMVNTAQEYIRAGDIFQVVPSQRVALPTGVHPFTAYRALRRVNPSPYMFYLHLNDFDIVGSSPELLVRLDGDTLMTHPIAGTRPRGASKDEDEALACELSGDEKERAEHIMLVDLGRNDIGRVAEPGSVSVPKLMEIERYSHVMHLVSNVTGEIREGLTGLDALRACFPAGTVSGAPKVRAMEIIAELEPEQRGPYAGAVGYVDYGGNLDTCITLRTTVMRDGVAYLQAGGGVVADSEPTFEYQETFHKMGALVRAIELAEEIERSAREQRRGLDDFGGDEG